MERLGYPNSESLQKANWFKLLWSISEEDLSELQGTDLVLYMKYIKYMACLFGLLMVLNLTVLLPVYSTSS